MKPSQRRKKTHMDEVYDRQHLNGHFTRLWNQKTTIDNKTPRSFYLNPRSTHYIGKTAGRSKSADGRLKPSNLDLHRRVMSGNKKLDMRRTEFAPVDSLTGNLMARRYERRFLQSDIMEKNFYHFAQPERAFEPRTLLTNFTQPKIIKSRNYQPPVFHRRNRFFDAMNLQSKPDKCTPDKCTNFPSPEILYYVLYMI
uniref:Uncharacterized protein n=1 Tax=Plectus sambesii TaxID=2011161 RepID=A0A914WXA3_9BILA